LTPDDVLDVHRLEHQRTLSAFGCHSRAEYHNVNAEPVHSVIFGALRVADNRAFPDLDFEDILRVLDAWGNEGGPEDLDGDGFVGFGDLLILLAAWGPCE